MARPGDARNLLRLQQELTRINRGRKATGTMGGGVAEGSVPRTKLAPLRKRRRAFVFMGFLGRWV